MATALITQTRTSWGSLASGPLPFERRSALQPSADLQRSLGQQSVSSTCPAPLGLNSLQTPDPHELFDAANTQSKHLSGIAYVEKLFSPF